MFKNISTKIFGLLILSSSFLAFTGCSPKIKMGLWDTTHQEAGLALGIWVANNADEATALLYMDCTDRKNFKKKITDALNNVPQEQAAQQGYGATPPQRGFPYGNARSQRSEDGFGNWCRKYPKAARKLRSHARALCKTGLGVLNGSIDVY